MCTCKLKLLTAITILGTVAGSVLSQGQAGTVISASQASDSEPYVFPLRTTGPGSRFLVDRNNRPFFWLGDAAWSLIAQLNREDADFYLDNRQEKGFTVLLVSLIEHKFSSNAPANIYGEKPFTGEPFITPNEKYFEHADYVISAADKRNMIVLLAPIYLGYNCKDEGWCSEVKGSTTEEMYQWGKYIGNRYKDFRNIIWCIGGDTDPSPVREKVTAMIRGIREFDKSHLFTAHNQPESMAVTEWRGEPWLTVNNVYSYSPLLYKLYREAYELKPVMPYYMCESTYENEHESTPQQLREQAYQALLTGAMGHIFGNCPVWHFGSNKPWCSRDDWKNELNNTGSVSMDFFQKLFRSCMWYSLVPDFNHAVITSGYGTWGKRDYVTAALTADRKTLIAYLPTAGTITLSMERIAGSMADCRWIDPSDGKSYNAGSFKTAAYQYLRPPSDGDWVLVVESREEKQEPAH